MSRIGRAYSANPVSFPYHLWYLQQPEQVIEHFEPIPTQMYQVAVAVPMASRR